MYTNSIQTCESDTTELSSLIASSTTKRLGRSLRLKIAVSKSTLQKINYNIMFM